MLAPSLYGIFPYSGLKFYFYEEMKSHVPDDYKKNIMVKLACGYIAGLLGQTFTYPLDVVRRQMHVIFQVLFRLYTYVQSKYEIIKIHAFDRHRFRGYALQIAHN